MSRTELATMDEDGRCFECHHDHSVTSRDRSYGDYAVAEPGHSDFCPCEIPQRGAE